MNILLEYSYFYEQEIIKSKKLNNHLGILILYFIFYWVHTISDIQNSTNPIKSYGVIFHRKNMTIIEIKKIYDNFLCNYIVYFQ